MFDDIVGKLKKPTNKPSHFWGRVGSIAVPILFYLYQKNWLTILIASSTFFFALVGPLIQLQWIRDDRAKQITAVILLTFLVGGIGLNAPSDSTSRASAVPVVGPQTQVAAVAPTIASPDNRKEIRPQTSAKSQKRDAIHQHQPTRSEDIERKQLIPESTQTSVNSNDCPNPLQQEDILWGDRFQIAEPHMGLLKARRLIVHPEGARELRFVRWSGVELDYSGFSKEKPDVKPDGNCWNGLLRLFRHLQRQSSRCGGIQRL